MGGFANGGLRYSSTIVHDFLKLSSFCDENSLYERPRKCTIAHDCAQVAESGLKPPFESPHSGHGEICPPHMGDLHWRPADQPTTRRSTWISCMVRIFLSKGTKPMDHVDRRVVGWSAGRQCRSPMWGANFAMAC